MSAVIEQIRALGHWEVSIRPVVFDAEAVAYPDLEKVITNAAVRLRGWPLPMVDHRQPILRLEAGIGQDIDAKAIAEHLEAWRFYTSAQFTQLRAVSADLRKGRRDAPHIPRGASGVVEVWDILFYLTELAELAARLALVIRDPAEGIFLEARLHNMMGRELATEPHRSLVGRYSSSLPDITATTSSTATELASDARGVAIRMSQTILSRFGLDISDAVLRDYQGELPGLS